MMDGNVAATEVDVDRVVEIARVCHEANRAYCKMVGDPEHDPWERAPDWQRDSAVAGVMFHMSNPDAGANASHDNWMAQKIADGWHYGEVKDPVAKTHPCMVPFEQLPTEQWVKDVMFTAIVRAHTEDPGWDFSSLGGAG